MTSTAARVGVRSVARGALQAGAWLGAATLASGVHQAVAQPEHGESNLTGDVVEVFGERLEQGLGTRYTAPLLETPQTITLVPRELIDQQNLLTMREILSTLPGITFTAGEGGGGYGDGVNLRGYTATNDISTDGVRDSAQYSRTDPFNLEQLELVSGANSVYTGAGSVGGSINLVTKTPRGMAGTVLEVAGGGDSYGRLTLDSESQVGDVADVRLNVMSHRNDVAGRDVERFERWGIAPSVELGGDSNTRVSVALLHQEDDNIPQYGVPYALNAFNDGPLRGVPTSAFYGYSNLDKQEIEVDAFTVIMDHEFADNLSLRNLTRWQQVDQLTFANQPQGAWCVETGVNPWTGAACAAPGTFVPSRSGTVRDTTNEIVVNQTDFTFDFATGKVEHTLVAGLSFSHETYRRANGNGLRNPLGATPNPVLPAMSIANPDHVYTGPVNFIVAQRADGEVDNEAAYVFDRIQLTERLEVNAGLRFEHNDAFSTLGNVAVPYPAPPAQPLVTETAPADNVDDLGSYRVGLVYKPGDNSSIYIAHGNSETPSQASVNGTCDILTTCSVAPEEAQTLEIGGKVDLNGQLSLTAAVFRNERSNFRVPSGDPTIPEQQLDGNSRVDGVALGAAGAIGTKWSVFANYTYLDSEVVQSVSDRSLLGGTIDIVAGDPLPNTPERSASVWATYRISDAFTVGYGLTYQGEYTFARASATADLYYTPDYVVHRAMATYEINDNLGLQLNVDNVTDEVYYERIRNNATNGWATPGAARSGVLSVTWKL
ncbi:MAG TPA: TonB-dependent receptor [Gammaproteobacteria bacterium]|nr:TonB-dependent receptor [Gammaproteobacteria bacterium]